MSPDLSSHAVKHYELVASPSEFARTHLLHPLLIGLDDPGPDFSFTRSYYPAYELLLVTRGSGSFRQGKEDSAWVALGEGDCLLHDMRYPHAYRANPHTPFEMLYIVFDGLDIAALWERFSTRPFIHLAVSAGQSTAAIRQQLLRVHQPLVQEEQPLNEIALSADLYELLLLTLSEGTGKPGGSTIVPQPLVEAKAWIDANYASLATIREAADHCNLSLYHFIRQFHRYFGCTPKEYVLLRRIHHAKRLLLHSNLSTAEVAEASGFPDYNALLRSFTKLEHCSPSVYRKNWQRRRF